MILIDMKMPKSGCTDCLLVKRGSLFLSRLCAVTGEIVDGNFERGGFPTECPLKKLQPHGRLIDEDVLIKTANNQKPLPIDFLKLLELVPTVIPAGPEEEEMKCPRN